MFEDQYLHTAATSIASKVRVNEICVGSNGVSDLDVDSIYLLMNHNTEAYINVFNHVNMMFDDPREFEIDIPVRLKAMRFAIEDIWSEPASKTTEWRDLLDTLAA